MEVVVAGAGIVGLSTAFYLQANNFSVTVVDPAPEGDKASFGNAAGIGVTECLPLGFPGIWKKAPGWLLDPLGPLFVKPSYAPRLLPWLIAFLKASTAPRIEEISRALAALNERVYTDYAPIWDALDYHDSVHRVGCLNAYNSRENYLREAGDWERKRACGVRFREVEGDQLREMEPALGRKKAFAIYAPDWSHIDDPKDMVDRLRAYLEARGTVFERACVKALSLAAEKVRAQLDNGKALEADYAVNAAGAWSAELAASLGDKALLESERGYNTTFADPGCKLRHEIIFAEEKFVATPLSIGLRIGGAAEFAGLNAPANYKRSDVLAVLARRFLPDLSDAEGDRWMGHRPATPDSLPVIGPSAASTRALHAFGHGHLGLTQAATTGRIIADLVKGERPGLDIAPYSIQRFGRARSA